jgi:hypothetical protein
LLKAIALLGAYGTRKQWRDLGGWGRASREARRRLNRAMTRAAVTAPMPQKSRRAGWFVLAGNGMLVLTRNVVGGS